MREEETYEFRFAASYRLPALAFGVTPATCCVRVRDEWFEVRFGPWRLATPLTNVAGAQVTGPFQYLKTAGPAHLSLADRGITCATNDDAGVCVRFDDPVSTRYPGLLPSLRHTAVTVTVTDTAGLTGRLTAPAD